MESFPVCLPLARSGWALLPGRWRLSYSALPHQMCIRDRNYHYETIRFWVDEFDIDGSRLDAADVLDFDFMRGLRRLANEVKPEFWLMGEVIHGDYSRWANPELLPSVTNYELHKGLWSGHNDHNYFEIAHTCLLYTSCSTRQCWWACGQRHCSIFSGR